MTVAKLATASYAQVWIPYTSTDLASFSWRENLMGPMRAVILARSSDDFPAIRAEVEKYRQVYNSKLKDMELIYSWSAGILNLPPLPPLGDRLGYETHCQAIHSYHCDSPLGSSYQPK